MAEQCTGRGTNGVVCAAAPLAALAGAQALREGGNAFDAAVTAALAETVLLPPKCGLGGDLVAVVLRAGQAEPESLLAIGGAPAGLAARAAAGTWRDVGADSVGPPAAACGYARLAEWGRLARARLAQPAIELATDGFPWASVCTRLTGQSLGLLEEMNPGGTVYTPGGEPIEPGRRTRLPGLAAVLGEWVERGAGLLEGPLGTAIVDAVRSRGGVLANGDLSFVTAEVGPCPSAVIDAQRVWVTDAPTHGPALLDALASATELSSPAAQLRAARAAIARLGTDLADRSGTSIVSAADRDGNAVVVVHSNSYPRFGSGIVVPGYDLVLANRAGRGFTPLPGHPNFPVAGRRPATTLHAWAVAESTGGPPRWLGGTPGGANQLPWNTQLVGALLSGTTEPGALVSGPVWELEPDGGVRIERGFERDATETLTAAADRARVAPRWGCKSAIQVIRLGEPGDPQAMWVGAADPRTQGAALGV